MSPYTFIAIIIAAAGLDFLSKLLLPRIALPMPAGITPDVSAEYGLLALISNINQYTLTPQAATVTAGTNSTLTAAQVCAGVVLLTAGASGGFTITLPSTAALITAMGPTIPTSGVFGFPLFVQNNNVGQTGTVTAGDASTTLSGTMTIATNTTRVFLVAVTSTGTLTVANVGSMAL